MKKKIPRRSFILVAPTKKSCMRMMLINEDNERTSHSITHSASVGVYYREKREREKQVHLDISLVLYLYQWSIYRLEEFSFHH